MISVTTLNIYKVIKSKYCKIVFLIFFIVSFFIIPKHVLKSKYIVEIVLFMLLFATNITCLIFDINKKVKVQRNNHTKWLSVITGVLGISALQFCGMNTLSCGSGIMLSLLGAILPNFLLHFMIEYGIWILRGSILVQVLSLYFMGCFKCKKFKRQIVF